MNGPKRFYYLSKGALHGKLKTAVEPHGDNRPEI